jgi:streptomycin 6-kinase
VLTRLAGSWQLSLGSLIQRGTVCVVIRCRTADGRPAVLKVSPDRGRVREEAAALACWQTRHVPTVLAVDEEAGALLVEAIEPGVPLSESSRYPALEDVAGLLGSLHAHGGPATSARPIADRIAHLFRSGIANYERRPDLAAVLPTALYERGRQLALRLAADIREQVVLHGDLTPANILDGGPERGLVAIDPAPCLGDPAFDAIDLVLWCASDVDTITVRAQQLDTALGGDGGRLLQWCAAFAAMTALELAEGSAPGEARVEPYLTLARAFT